VGEIIFKMDFKIYRDDQIFRKKTFKSNITMMLTRQS